MLHQVQAIVFRGAVKLSSVPAIGAEAEGGGHGAVGLGFGNGVGPPGEIHQAVAGKANFAVQNARHCCFKDGCCGWVDRWMDG